jgi:hypothetical protein
MRKQLSLRDLVFYDIVAVTPSAPVTVFGIASVALRPPASWPFGRF